jgi:hypothetical protein
MSTNKALYLTSLRSLRLNGEGLNVLAGVVETLTREYEKEFIDLAKASVFDQQNIESALRAYGATEAMKKFKQLLLELGGNKDASKLGSGSD